MSTFKIGDKVRLREPRTGHPRPEIPEGEVGEIVDTDSFFDWSVAFPSQKRDDGTVNHHYVNGSDLEFAVEEDLASDTVKEGPGYDGPWLDAQDVLGAFDRDIISKEEARRLLRVDAS